ncbi:PREDICTED: LIM homeobox transcription factor 1-beta-like isoform X2 [Ceratosolen solmsi marchali]|uniref:LIM homeobox transcription factor 1-beta-like isoform X2 n=1 Tax=Ceratosolen solmsi marchali TaxID=326594 RepID=A0AAJ7DU05_9HYME|nr:PREDICTED: LIM homeobox transcription factor 1-beta-like isoform X2 [Ceratosolen solmsi marchali]
MLEHFPAMVQSSLGPMTEVGMGPALSVGPPIGFRQAANNNVGEGTISVKRESNLIEGVCANCGHGIADRYVMRVDERNYHENCLACAECSTPLSDSCYARDCKFYCRADYKRLYAVKCARCQQKIDCNDLVMRMPVQSVNGRPDGPVFHVACFVCCICGDPLLRGAHFILRHGQPLCKREFPNDIYNMNSLQDDDLLDDSRPRDGRRGPKRPRTILTSAQRRQFKASFEVSPKPCRKVREALAKETGLSVRVVQVWFQNQRAKMKKMQRKVKAEPGSDKEPKEERKPDSPHSDHNAYPVHSGESYYSSDTSMDGTEIGENENAAGIPDVSHSHHASGTGSGTGAAGGGGVSGGGGSAGGVGPDMLSLSESLHSAVHNPIDKLFMMQTSYFSSADHP